MDDYGTAKSSASQIEREIEGLRYNHRDSSAPFLSIRYHYREFWAHAREISQLFKSSRLLREDRERLWESYREICEEVRRKQNEERGESERSREILQSLITDAYFRSEGATSRQDLDQAKSMQSETLRLMKERRLSRDDREKLWKYWKEVSGKITFRRQELQQSSYLHVREGARRCHSTAYNGDPYQALREIREVSGDLRGAYLDRDRRSEIRDTLNDAWKRAMSRIAETKEEKKRKHEEWLRRKEERERKHREWRARTEANIERWESNVEKAERVLSRLEANIDRLEDMAANARTDAYADRVRGWIQENYQRIQSIRESVREFESKIHSARSRLNS